MSKLGGEESEDVCWFRELMVVFLRCVRGNEEKIWMG